MDTTGLLALGAAGGSLRGLVDAYNQVVAWQAARRDHRRGPAAPAREMPRLTEYVDPLPDSVATAFHMALGAAGAAMFGLSGQITGAYAAIAVGISAPALLTQLGRVQSVSEAVTGVVAPAGAPPPPRLAGVPDQEETG
ncbi:hypothetical protein V2S66_00275 [Streptomyces sp. V4-01]|uniref:ABC transmembrane type-1 domain-containing protein n=1 Tax=Actinacidiphila polyblastidii TaxID=3110430 RepID=A0ABU7P545_9ACTN|nr:hypothetical protein [Streptomyces sp. V4-01]